MSSEERKIKAKKKHKEHRNPSGQEWSQYDVQQTDAMDIAKFLPQTSTLIHKPPLAQIIAEGNYSLLMKD